MSARARPSVVAAPLLNDFFWLLKWELELASREIEGKVKSEENEFVVNSGYPKPHGETECEINSTTEDFQGYHRAEMFLRSLGHNTDKRLTSTLVREFAGFREKLRGILGGFVSQCFDNARRVAACSGEPYFPHRQSLVQKAMRSQASSLRDQLEAQKFELEYLRSKLRGKNEELEELRTRVLREVEHIAGIGFRRDSVEESKMYYGGEAGENNVFEKMREEMRMELEASLESRWTMRIRDCQEEMEQRQVEYTNKLNKLSRLLKEVEVERDDLKEIVAGYETRQTENSTLSPNESDGSPKEKRRLNMPSSPFTASVDPEDSHEKLNRLRLKLKMMQENHDKQLKAKEKEHRQELEKRTGALRTEILRLKNLYEKPEESIRPVEPKEEEIDTSKQEIIDDLKKNTPEKDVSESVLARSDENVESQKTQNAPVEDTSTEVKKEEIDEPKITEPFLSVHCEVKPREKRTQEENWMIPELSTDRIKPQYEDTSMKRKSVVFSNVSITPVSIFTPRMVFGHGRTGTRKEWEENRTETTATLVDIVKNREDVKVMADSRKLDVRPSTGYSSFVQSFGHMSKQHGSGSKIPVLVRSPIVRSGRKKPITERRDSDFLTSPWS